MNDSGKEKYPIAYAYNVKQKESITTYLLKPTNLKNGFFLTLIC